MATIKIEEMAPAIVEQKQLAVAPVTALPRGMSGDFSLEDVPLPVIRLVGKTGALTDEFPAGSYVYDGSVVLSDGKTPLSVTVIQFHKKYQEVRPYDDENDTPALVLQTEQEVKAAGGGFGKDAVKPFQPIAHIQFLIEAPASLAEEDKGRFGLQFEGKRYAFAAYSALSKTAYNAVGREITRQVYLGPLKSNLCASYWNLTAELIKGQKNSWWGPKLEIKGDNSPAFIEWVTGIMG